MPKTKTEPQKEAKVNCVWCGHAATEKTYREVDEMTGSFCECRICSKEETAELINKLIKRNKSPQTVYLAEFIGEDNNWEWWDVYDSGGVTLLQVFDNVIGSFQGHDITPTTEKDLKKEGGYHIHKGHDIRVWEIKI